MLVKYNDINVISLINNNQPSPGSNTLVKLFVIFIIRDDIHTFIVVIDILYGRVVSMFSFRP